MLLQSSLRPILCLALLAGCSGLSRPPVEPAPEIPADVRAFFRNPTIHRVALSPDGTRIAGVMTIKGLPVLIEREIASKEFRFIKKVDEPGMNVHTVGWSGDELLVVGFERPASRVRNRGRRSRMLAIRMMRQGTRDGQSWVHPLPPGLERPVLDWLVDDPEQVLVHWWEAGSAGASVERVTVRSGYSETVVRPHEGVYTYYSDHHGEVRAALARSVEDGADRVFVRRSGGGAFEPLVSPGPKTMGELEFAGYSPDPSRLYVRAYNPEGRKALYEFDVLKRELGRQVYAHPSVDVGRVITSPEDSRLLALEIEPVRPELVFFDIRSERRQASVDAAFPDTVNRIVARDRDDRRVLLRVSGGTHPPEFYLYDTVEGEASFLYAEFPELKQEHLSVVKRIRYVARDGLDIPGYLTLPRDLEPRGLPLIVIPHDGPSRRDSWEWNPLVQFLANRGYAVLQPNYRGSTGYGRDHEKAGDGEWGGAMQEDLIDGVRWLVGQGIADPRRVGIYGAGYGGYSALISAMKEPELFRAVVTFGAITDLIDLRDHPHHFRSGESNLPRFGNLPRHSQQLAEISPALRADRFRAPLFVAHGAEDPVVDRTQADNLIRALEQAGARYESRIYPVEPNFFVGEKSRIDFHYRLLRFFDTHLTLPDAL